MTAALEADLFWKTRVSTRRGDAALARRAGAFPYFAEVSSAIDRTAVVDGTEVLMFGSNNYLGLAGDERVVGAATDAIAAYGSGCTGSRLMNGTLDLHAALEHELADWVGLPKALVFTTGYLANLAAISTLCAAGDVVVGDDRNHASLVDGASLSKAEAVTVRHGDLGALDSKLGRLRARTVGGLLVAWDSVFSMEGDVANIDGVVTTAKRHRARVLVDEAHALGVLGPDGAGVAAAAARDGNPVDLVMGTFSKSLASCGGFVAGPADVIEFLRISARPFLFTAAGVPAAVAAALAAARIARSEGWRREACTARAAELADGLRSVGADVSWGGAAIVAVHLRDEWTAFRAWRQLLDHGVYVNVGVAPAVQAGTAVLRLSTTATHTPDDVCRCVDTFAALGDITRSPRRSASLAVEVS